MDHRMRVQCSVSGALEKGDHARLVFLDLRRPRLKSLCSQAQVFRKNCFNSSANDRQKRRPKAPFDVSSLLDSQLIVSVRLPLRELERLARLGAAVLLALDDARVAGEKAALFQNAAQIRL